MAANAPRPATSVAVLGTGIMGAPMALRLVHSGLATTVWNRSATSTEALGAAGARVATSPRDAVADVDVVVTMLPTYDVVRAIMLDDGTIDALAQGATWCQMGTIGVENTRELAADVAQRRPDVLFVDAPVSGSKGPAESGTLVILAGGPGSAQQVLEPVFSAIGRSTVWLGEVGQGSELKLVVNAFLAMVVEGMAETLSLADHYGIPHETLADALRGGPLDAPIALAKMGKMDRGDYAVEFPLEWALKDVDLALESAGDRPLPALSALSASWHHGVDRGLGREDISAARAALEE